MIARGLEMFYCDRLDCRLTKKSCAERHAKAIVLKFVEYKGVTIWRPSVWAYLESTCRECETGDLHLAENPIEVKVPTTSRELSPPPSLINGRSRKPPKSSTK